MESAAGGWEADRQDEAGESHRRGELEQSNVVVISVRVVVGMIDDLCYGPRHLVGVSSFLALTTQIHDQTICAGAEVKRRETKLSKGLKCGAAVKSTSAEPKSILRPVLYEFYCSQLMERPCGAVRTPRLENTFVCLFVCLGPALTAHLKKQ